MDIKFSTPALPVKGIYAVPVQAGKKLSPAVARQLGKPLAASITTALKNAGGFNGDMEQFLWLNGLLTGKTPLSIVLYGVGAEATINPADSLKIGGLLLAQCKMQSVPDAHIIVSDAIELQSFASGAALRAYQFADYKTKGKNAKTVPLKTLTFHTDTVKQAQKEWKTNRSVMRGVYLARDLMNQPPNICTPAGFVKQVKAALKGVPVKITVLDETAIAKKGMGALQAVARGNRHDPYVMIVEYKGKAATAKNSKPVALVGKGVTFDTGGYNIKSGIFTGGGMFDMKFDMCGAAAVMGTLVALATGQAAVHAIGIVGLTENLIDEDAYLPGEVITTLSGQTVEVLDTDAEGRLVLADLLTYVQDSYKPKAIIDIATLTGSAMMALGNEYAALFSNNDALAENLTRAGYDTGEKCWRMPIDAAPQSSLKSPIADFINVELSRLAGASFAALFLSQFVDKNIPWAHLDIAGVMKARGDLPTCPAGGMGYGVRLMHNYALHHG